MGAEIELGIQNTYERELIGYFISQGCLKSQDVTVKDGKVIDILINDDLMKSIINFEYSELNIKKLLHLKSIKSIAFDYRYSFALAKFFLRNNDIISAQIQFKTAHNLVEDKHELQDYSKILGFVYSLAIKKVEKAISDFSKYNLYGLIKAKSPETLEKLAEIININQMNEDLVKKNRVKIMDILIKILI